MPAGIVLAPDRVEPRAVAETVGELDPGVAAELAPAADAEAVLAEFDGDRYPPLGGYEVGPTVAARDVTLATGSRRFDDVLARLSVATRSLSVPGVAPDTRPKHEG